MSVFMSMTVTYICLLLILPSGFLQLLDIARACWVQESPPTTADIVDQLTDHVTETEL